MPLAKVCVADPNLPMLSVPLPVPTLPFINTTTLPIPSSLHRLHCHPFNSISSHNSTLIFHTKTSPYTHNKMCSSKAKTCRNVDLNPIIAQINGRLVLQPTCNRVSCLERRHSLKKISAQSPPPPPTPTTPPPITTTSKSSTRIKASQPISPKSKSARTTVLKRGNDPNGLNSSIEKELTPKSGTRKKSKKSSGGVVAPSIQSSSLNYSSSFIVEAPGSIAAARREQVILIQAQRKMRIAHYGRTKSPKFEGKVVPVDSSCITISATDRVDKRCSFITPNSDPLYVAYHDEEWGVPVHDEKLLFELLVLSGAQVGSDWTSILKKRQNFRDAFSGFDAEIVSCFTERQMTSISADYGIDLSRVRGVVDNSNRILEIRRKFGSFAKYIWEFVNHKSISTQYKSCHKMPVKTSKSETISKDMVRRGLRFVGPTVMHSFMQAAGLTNDHLITCPRHLQCMESWHPTKLP